MNEGQLAQMTWTEVLRVTYQVMSFELFEVDGHGLSLGKLLSGVILFVLGYLLSKRASRAIDRRLLTRLDIDEALRYTFRRLIFYFFLCVSTLFTLHTLAVPVTIFAVLGGALAVGVGFGSQNLVNNFISGVLVMVERPIRVGDFVEVDGVSGKVQSIGIRSTVLRTGLNAVVALPNTTFIDKNLTNWTLSSSVMYKVSVGVAYGTDLELLRQVCREAVASVPQIEKEPGSDLMFQDFGDSALLFDVTYYLSPAAVHTRLAIASEVRFRLNELFIRHDIQVPFPQRQVRMLT